MDTSRTLYKGMKKRKGTMFSTENQPLFNTLTDSTSSSCDSSTSTSTSISTSTSNQQLERLSKSTTDLIKQDKKQPTLPFKLRPELKKEKEQTERQNDSFLTAEPNNFEYGIVKIQTISFLMNNFLKNHNRHGCKFPNVELVKEKHIGLCITAILKCTKCSLTSDKIDMFDKTHSGIKKSGPNAGCLNEALPLACLKTKMGMTDIQFFLSTLSIRPPSLTLLQRKLNNMSDLMVQLNETSMIKNQEKVRQILKLSNDNNNNNVSVETDASYNNRIQLGFEAGTQTFAPMIENVTNQKLTLSLQYVNKLCNKKNNNCDHQTCHKNYPDNKSIASSEGHMVTENVKKINDTGILNVNSITSDACNQINKICKTSATTNKPIRHFNCFIHKMRNFSKHIHFLKFTESTNTFNLEKTQYAKQLALSLRKRVQKEIVRVNKRSRSEIEFIKSSSLCLKNIMDCFQNNHSMCHTLSTVCEAHKSSFKPSFLPCGKFLQLSNTDLNKIQGIILKDFSHSNLHELYGLKTTNKSESMHNRVFKHVTKRVTWSRNFGAMCHSAVHSDTFGTGKSAMLLAKEAGILYSHCGPFYDHMRHLDSTNKYHKSRQRSERNKLNRYFRKLNRFNHRLSSNSLYRMPSASTELHNYAIKPM